MRVVALDTHDGHCEGEEYDVPEHRALKLIAKGLVKAGRVPQNKMAPQADNKQNPIPAVGEAHIVSSSPAALVLPPMTATAFANGERNMPMIRRRGRPRKSPDASSQ